jgi:MoxR-like ATPase
MISDVSPILGERAFLVAQEAVDEVEVPEDVARALVRVVRATRTEGSEVGASPRASRHLMTAAKARAAVRGRASVEVDDVVTLAPYVLEHRIRGEKAAAAQVVRDAMQAGFGA